MTNGKWTHEKIYHSFRPIAALMDGNGTIGSVYDKFTDYGNKPGRIICMSGGNYGDVKSCIYKNLNADNDYTMRKFLYLKDKKPCLNSLVRFYSSDTTHVSVSVELYDSNTGKLLVS